MPKNEDKDINEIRESEETRSQTTHEERGSDAFSDSDTSESETEHEDADIHIESPKPKIIGKYLLCLMMNNLLNLPIKENNKCL